MALSLAESYAIASLAEHTVSAIMRKATVAERREALFAAFNRSDLMHQRALYGAVASLLARCDGVPPAKAEGR